MARITVEDCLSKENNRFALVQLASQRAKQLLAGAKARIDDSRDNRSVVVALREIADGWVRFMSEDETRVAREVAEREREVAREKETQAVSNPDLKAREALDELFKSVPAVEGDDDEGEDSGAVQDEVDQPNSSAEEDEDF